MTEEEFENIVMSKLLDGNHEMFNVLKRQYKEASVISREFTGCGFLTQFDVPQSLSLDNINGKIDDVKAEFVKHKGDYLLFILYISNGKIDALEGFATIDTWKKDYDVLINYCYDGIRKFELNGSDFVTEQFR